MVAVCCNFTQDSKTKKLHCDKSRENILLPPIIFHKDFTYPNGENYKYFLMEKDGSIKPRPYTDEKMNGNIYLQLMAFIEILNLNHDNLQKARSNIIRDWGIELITKSKREIKIFWQDKHDLIINNLSFPFRQFFLIYIHDNYIVN